MKRPRLARPLHDGWSAWAPTRRHPPRRRVGLDPPAKQFRSPRTIGPACPFVFPRNFECGTRSGLAGTQRSTGARARAKRDNVGALLAVLDGGDGVDHQADGVARLAAEFVVAEQALERAFQMKPRGGQIALQITSPFVTARLRGTATTSTQSEYPQPHLNQMRAIVRGEIGTDLFARSTEVRVVRTRLGRSG